MALWTPDFVQGIDPSPRRFRVVHDDLPVQPGVVVTPWDAEPFAVKQASGGAAMTLDVSPGMAWVANSTALQGLYHVVNDATVVTSTIASNPSGNPRLDKIVLTVRDDIDGGATAGQKNAIIQVVQGTPTATANWYNQLGAAAVPSHSLLLADVVVPNGAASIVTANIMDRRPWAHGLYSLRRINNAGANQVFTTTTLTTLFDSLLTRRVELSPWPGQTYARLRATLVGQTLFPATSGVKLLLFLATSSDGGTTWVSQTPGREVSVQASVASNKAFTQDFEVQITPPGSYLVAFRAQLAAANATGVTVYGATATTTPLTGIVEQLVP